MSGTQRWIGLAVAAAVLAGCASGVRLADERTTPPYAALLARNAAARHEIERFRVQARGSSPLDVSLEYVTSGGESAAPVIVLQPGILADGTTWRFLVGALVADHDLLVVNPPGCGRSATPDPGGAGPEAYSPTWLAEHTLLAVDAWRARLAPSRDLVLVGHSLGATVVLRMLADPGLRSRHTSLLARVRGAVLLAPADVAMESVGPRITEIAEVTDLEAGIGCCHGIARSKVAQGVHENTLRPERDALRADADRIAEMLCRADTRHAAQAMLRRFRPQDDRGRPIRAALEPLLSQERSISTPILVLWGERDETLPFSQAGPLLARLPSARLESLPDAMHSIQQERAEEVGRRVRRFVASLPRSP